MNAVLNHKRRIVHAVAPRNSFGRERTLCGHSVFLMDERTKDEVSCKSCLRALRRGRP